MKIRKLAAAVLAALLFGAPALSLADNSVVTGSSPALAPGACVGPIALTGAQSSVTLTVGGTFAGTVTISGVGGDGASLASLGTVTAVGVTTYSAASYNAVQACLTAYTSGAPSVQLYASSGVPASSGAAAPGAGPVPTASAGIPPPASAQTVVALNACIRPVGGSPAVTPGNEVAQRCTNGGKAETASVICGASSIDTEGTCVQPAAAPSASPGVAPPALQFPVTAYNTCAFNTGTIAVTNTFSIPNQCNNKGELRVASTCTNTAAVNISTAVTTSIVAVSGTTAVYICGYHLYVVSGTLPSFQFEYGTGAACSTPTILSGTFGGIAAAIGESFETGAGLGYLLSTPASNGFCIVSGGTLPNIQGWVSYAQY